MKSESFLTLDTNATTSFKALKGSKDIIKIVQQYEIEEKKDHDYMYVHIY